MKDAQTTVLCNQQKDESNAEQVLNCQMYVRHEVKPGQVTFITLTYDESVDLAVIAASLSDRDSPLI